MNSSDLGAVSMEKVEGVHKLAQGSKWLQAASKRMKRKGTVGSLTRIAKQHGETAMEFAHQHAHDKQHPSWAKKALFAVNANKNK
jgi:hypothetical protein